MTLQSSGPISLNDINIELGLTSQTVISLNDTAVRTLLQVPSGTISLSNAYGKINRSAISYTFTSNTTQNTLTLSSIAGYRAGKSDITITINSGIYVYSTSTATPALTLAGGSVGDTVTLNNNGYILGCGGAGGYLGAAGAGGPALSISRSVSINNAGYIAGGGGGGGQSSNEASGGGGAGGGHGGNNTYGGAGGGPGASGGNATTYTVYGGGGGRICPGTGGSYVGVANGYSGNGGGAGGGGGGYRSGPKGPVVCGGGGGGWGASGGTGGSGTPGVGGSGSSAGGSASSPSAPYYGAAGGKAIALNGYTVTWKAGNTRVYGIVS